MTIYLQRDDHALHFRLGRFALTVKRYPCRIGWCVRKWRYYDRESWWHGTAYMGRFKLIW
jgi:hypothetical protein